MPVSMTRDLGAALVLTPRVRIVRLVLCPGNFIHGVLGIAQDIDEDLQRLVLVHGGVRERLEVADDGDVVALKLSMLSWSASSMRDSRGSTSITPETRA